MKTKSIEEGQWRSFADQFSRTHDGWVGSLSLIDDGSVKTELEEGAFRGVSLDKRSGDHGPLILTFGYEPDEHFAHIIQDPRGLLLSVADDGANASLRIDAGKDGICVLALSNPMREEDFLGA